MEPKVLQKMTTYFRINTVMHKSNGKNHNIFSFFSLLPSFAPFLRLQ